MRQVVLASVFALSLSAHPAMIAAETDAVRFTATEANLRPGREDVVQIVVNHWSSDDDRARLLSQLTEKGPDRLLQAVQDLKKIGYILAPGSPAYDLKYAHRSSLPGGGDRVVLATDRPLAPQEMALQTPSVLYPVTVVVLNVTAEGAGGGQLFFAGKISVDKKTKKVSIEDLNSTPIVLSHVTREPMPSGQ
jgi:hypothetical protein